MSTISKLTVVGVHYCKSKAFERRDGSKVTDSTHFRLAVSDKNAGDTVLDLTSVERNLFVFSSNVNTKSLFERLMKDYVIGKGAQGANYVAIEETQTTKAINLLPANTPLEIYGRIATLSLIGEGLKRKETVTVNGIAKTFEDDINKITIAVAGKFAIRENIVDDEPISGDIPAAVAKRIIDANIKSGQWYYKQGITAPDDESDDNSPI